eukprot:scpid65028/ scgid32632/ 
MCAAAAAGGAGDMAACAEDMTTLLERALVTLLQTGGNTGVAAAGGGAVVCTDNTVAPLETVGSGDATAVVAVTVDNPTANGDNDAPLEATEDRPVVDSDVTDGTEDLDALSGAIEDATSELGTADAAETALAATDVAGDDAVLERADAVVVVALVLDGWACVDTVSEVELVDFVCEFFSESFFILAFTCAMERVLTALLILDRSLLNIAIAACKRFTSASVQRVPLVELAVLQVKRAQKSSSTNAKHSGCCFGNHCLCSRTIISSRSSNQQT